MRSHVLGRDGALIGEEVWNHPRIVVVRSLIGGQRGRDDFRRLVTQDLLRIQSCRSVSGQPMQTIWGNSAVNRSKVREFTDETFYEGYILYPYRVTPMKHHKGLDFGALYPTGNHAGELSSLQMQCLVLGRTPSVEIEARFLHLMNRQVLDANGRCVQSIDVDGTIVQTWQEAVPREVIQPHLELANLVRRRQRDQFSFASEPAIEAIRNRDGLCVGSIYRSQAIDGELRSSCEQIDGETYRLMVEMVNVSTPTNDFRDEALMDQVLASAHFILSARQGEFVSLTNPPPQLVSASDACKNVRVWPVLVGAQDERNCLLAAPIPLCDHPQIETQTRELCTNYP